MKVIIVEDEEPARELVKKFLSDEIDMEFIGEYADGFSGAVAINNDKPDLILLDIQLPRLSGFELLEILDFTPQIIFTTAYDEYAIKAFEQNATDYLLKPFSKERFRAALEKAREKFDASAKSPKTAFEMAEDLSNSIPLDRMVIKDSKGIHVIATKDIYYFEAQDDYIMIHSNQGRFMKKQTMKSLENRLNQKHFARVHRSFIANVMEITRIEPYEKDSYIALLKNGSKIKVSAAGYKQLKSILDF